MEIKTFQPIQGRLWHPGHISPVNKILFKRVIKQLGYDNEIH